MHRMRTTIDLNDELIERAMRLGGFTTKKAAIETALREFVRHADARDALNALRGIGWEGDLDAMRRGDPPPELP